MARTVLSVWKMSGQSVWVRLCSVLGKRAEAWGEGKGCRSALEE
jgi:hypothetical protein